MLDIKKLPPLTQPLSSAASKYLIPMHRIKAQQAPVSDAHKASWTSAFATLVELSASETSRLELQRRSRAQPPRSGVELAWR